MPSTRLLVLATLVVLVTAPVSQAVAVDAPTPASTTASTATDRPTPAVGPQAASITNGSVEATANGSAGAVDDQGPENRTDAGSAVASSAASAAAGPGAVGTALAVVESAANTTNYMDVRNRDVERDGYARSSVDVFGAIEHDVAAIRSNYTAASLEHETAAQSDRATVESIRTAVDRITRRIDALKTRQERAFERYNAREWSTRRFLRELSTVDAVARGLEYRLGRMDGVFRQDLPQVVGERIGALELELVALQGPVRRSIGDAMAGEHTPFTTYAVASTDGVVLTRTDALFAFREAYLGANYAQEGPNQFISNEDLKGLRNAINRVRELYPWVWANTAPDSIDILEDVAYRFSLRHPHGNLVLYLDGRTTEVFREIQQPRLDRLPTEPAFNVSDGVELHVNRTYGTGPMQVTVRNESGPPLNATVLVNGFAVGSTGADGRLWTVTPYQDVRVVVETADGRRVSVTFVAE